VGFWTADCGFKCSSVSTSPIMGVLFDDMAIPDGGDLLALQSICSQRAEAEGSHLSLGADLKRPRRDARRAVAAAVARVAAAIEIVDRQDRRLENHFFCGQPVADNGSIGIFSSCPATLSRWTGSTCGGCGMVMQVNGADLRRLGAGAALSRPIPSMQPTWLRAKRSPLGVNRCAPGDLILTGALGPMGRVAAGRSSRGPLSAAWVSVWLHLSGGSMMARQEQMSRSLARALLGPIIMTPVWRRA